MLDAMEADASQPGGRVLRRGHIGRKKLGAIRIVGTVIKANRPIYSRETGRPAKSGGRS